MQINQTTPINPNISPQISIITVTFNNHDGLLKTLFSVRSQSYHLYEHIVIDGGSNDGTLKALETFNNSNLKWLSEPDNGIYHAMNKGIELSSGRWLLFLNAGDTLFDTNTLEKITSKLDVSYGIVFGQIELLFDKNHRKIKAIPPQISPFHLRFCNHQTAFIRNDLIKKLKYDENYKICGDSDFFARAYLAHEKFKNIEDTICCFDTQGVSSNLSLVTFKESLKIGKRFFKIYPITFTLYYTLWVVPRALSRKILPDTLVLYLRSK